MDSGELRPFEGDSGHAHVVDTPTGPVGRGVFNPGWGWSGHVKPIAGTDSCEAALMADVISGRMTLTMDDGTSEQFGPGDLMIAPPGHDAVVDGDDPCVVIDWQGIRGRRHAPADCSADEAQPPDHLEGGRPLSRR